MSGLVVAAAGGLLLGIALGRIWRDVDADAAIEHLRLEVQLIDQARARYRADAERLRDQRDAALVGVSEARRRLEAAGLVKPSPCPRVRAGGFCDDGPCTPDCGDAYGADSDDDEVARG